LFKYVLTKGESRVGERGAEVEARAVGFRKGVSPSPTGEGSGEWGEDCAPSPVKCFEFLSRNGPFLCILQQ